jgi:hypothetical protein
VQPQNPANPVTIVAGPESPVAIDDWSWPLLSHLRVWSVHKLGKSRRRGQPYLGRWPRPGSNPLWYSDVFLTPC